METGVGKVATGFSFCFSLVFVKPECLLIFLMASMIVRSVWLLLFLPSPPLLSSFLF